VQRVVRIDEAKDDSHDEGKSSPRRIAYDLWRCKLIYGPARLKLTTSGRQYISHPAAFSPIGERDPEHTVFPKNIHRRPVQLPRPSADISDNSEARQPRGKADKESIRNCSVEGRYTSPAKSDKQDWRQQ
jgi:hypothetical protein